MSCQHIAYNKTGMHRRKSHTEQEGMAMQLADDADLAVPIAKHISGGCAPGHDAAEV